MLSLLSGVREAQQLHIRAKCIPEDYIVRVKVMRLFDYVMCWNSSYPEGAGSTAYAPFEQLEQSQGDASQRLAGRGSVH